MPSSSETTGLEIAVIGMAGRFPGADDIDSFWANIRDGVESVKRYSEEELRALGVPQSLLDDAGYVKAGVPLAGMDLFDADFFGYTPRDAEQLDPQHRLFLECAWQALEHAGYGGGRYPGAIGVYAGTGASVYLMRHLLPRHAPDHGTQVADLLGLMSGNMADALATRVAYKLDLRGPAVTVQTACSTSLMAVHTACQALLGHECAMALAGGVSLNLLQNGGYRYQAGAIFSPDGHCRAFDAQAAGTLQGSGAGIVVLKRLDDALQDGDTIHAVILASAANNDGADKVGFTAPGVNGQAAVVRAAQALAGVPADTIGYVEAHGTATALGDPIEIAALTQAFRASTQRRGYCAIGSVKTNIGHLDAAAGVTGLIKAVLSLRHATLPPSLHFERPHPQIDFERSPFHVNTVAKPWPRAATPRRAGVSAFGIGGTNVHVVLQEAAAAPSTSAGTQADAARGWHVLPLSARSPRALDEAARRLAAHLQQAGSGLSLDDVAHTLQQGRRAFGHRRAVVAHGMGMAVEGLQLVAGPAVQATEVPAQTPAQVPGVVFLFPGGGVQHANMGLDLYRSEHVFRQEVDRCCDLLQAETGWDLRRWLFPAPGDEVEADAALSAMDKAQPALFVVGYALARLWMARGVQPVSMLGHSLGEYVAACLAGVFELPHALRIVAARGRLLQSLPQGAMTSVPLAEAELQPLLDAGCDLGAVNGERLCVLSGPLAAIEAAEEALRVRDITARRLHIAVASHSAMTEPLMAQLEQVVASAPRHAPRLAFISSVTGQPVTPEQAMSPAYWARHLRDTVRFADGLDGLLRVPGRGVLEVGPGEALTALVRQHPRAATAAGIWPSQAHPQQTARSAQQMAQATAGLWCAGVDIDWTACRGGRPGRRVPLPTYAFQRRSFWVQAAGQGGDALKATGSAGPSGLAGPSGPFYAAAWQRSPLQLAAGTATAAAQVALVFGDGSATAEALVHALRAQGTDVVCVEAGAAPACLAPGRHAVRPGERSDCEALLDAVQAQLGPVDAIYHLWAMDTAAPASLERGFHSVLALAQALEARAHGDGAPRERRLLLVAAGGSEDVTGLEALNPEMAAVFPLCKAIGQECPSIDCRFVDVVQAGSPAMQARLARQLLDEARAPHGLRMADTAIALRGPHRWRKTYEPLRWRDAEAPRLRRQGVYLITGGLGGVGLALARHLAAHWQASLVLVGRTALPARSQWEALAADEAQPRTLRQQLLQLLALEAEGAQVLTLAADVADAAQMQAALAQARQRFGALHGVVHAAGHADSGMLATRTRDSVERVFAPKLRGTRLLLDLLGTQVLDFVLLCSSISSLTAGLGKSDYAAANACMDALAALASRQRAWPVISVDWDAWRDLGMAAGMHIPEGIGWSGPEAAAVFERIVNGDVPHQVVISTTDLQQRLGEIDAGLVDALAESAAEAFAEPADGSQARRAHPRPALQNAYVAAEGELQQALAALWTDMLGIAPVGVDDNLFELGGDSLLAIQILARVKKSFGVELHPAAFFKAPTVGELAVLVETRLIEEIEATVTDEGDALAAFASA
ncbi:type I polyketide synthase [Delftia acidovorans]|uniref:type I polyketide synthase n=1 Tax=Delftia acidovorans TaxID=80866 RepID=UPI00301A4092